VPARRLIGIVDDDELVREATKGLMRSLGFSAEAYASAKDFLASPNLDRIACLIADLNMPEMSGIELHGHLVASGRKIPTVLITAYPDEDVRARALNAGIICYLTKPFAEDDLLACIQSALPNLRPAAQP
jgi:FixJ family two-component response regulator